MEWSSSFVRGTIARLSSSTIFETVRVSVGLPRRVLRRCLPVGPVRTSVLVNVGEGGWGAGMMKREEHDESEVGHG